MDQTRKLRLKLRRTDIAYVQFILEGYDGLGRLSTVDPLLALAVLSYPQSRQAEAHALTSALRAEGVIQEVISCEI